MAQFTFSGDPRAPGTDPAQAEIGGVIFPFGKAVTVEDEALAAKLRTHSHFTETKTAKAPKTDETGLKAEHNGGGRFIITRGEVVVQKGLTKADADVFNAMSPEDKAQYVAKPE